MILSIDGAQMDGCSVGLAWAASCVCSQIAAWARTSCCHLSGTWCRQLGHWLSWDVQRVGLLSYFHVNSGLHCRKVAGHLRWQFKAPRSAKVEAVSAMSHFCYIPLVKVGHSARMIQCGRVPMRVWIWGHMVHWGHPWKIATTHSDTIHQGQENWKRYGFEERRAFKLNFE